VEAVLEAFAIIYKACSGRVPMAVHLADSVIRVSPVSRILFSSCEAKTVRLARRRDRGIRQMLEMVEQDFGDSEPRIVVLYSKRSA